MIILLNAICCNNCRQVLVSSTRYDFRACSCGACSADGGKDYLKRSGDNFEEMSIVQEKKGGIFRKVIDVENKGKVIL